MADYAYILENIDPDNSRDNSYVFKLIQDLDIHEDSIFIDTADVKEELENLADTIGYGDRLIIRSVKDLANDPVSLLDILKSLQDRQITLCSCCENFLNGTEYHTNLKCFIELHKYYLNLKQTKGFDKAMKAGIVGRPKNNEGIDKALRLHDTKAFSIEEIEKLSGISSSTLYRYLKDRDKK